MEWLIILVLIVLNGLLSMSEIAVLSSRKVRLEAEEKRGNKKSSRVLHLLDHTDKFLSTIQIGITLISILTGLFSGAQMASSLAALLMKIGISGATALVMAKAVIVVLVTYLTLVLGELLPKHIGMRYPEKVAGAVAGLMHGLSVVVHPFVWILAKSTQALLKLLGIREKEDEKVTEEEIRAQIEEGTEDGEIEERVHDTLVRALNLSDRAVDTVMTYRSELVWLDLQDGIADIKAVIYGNPHDVYPVAVEQLDEIKGVVFLKDMFGQTEKPDFGLEPYVKEALFFPENMSVYNALEQLKEKCSKYALVTDEFGGVQGIVTLSDILEALIGEMPDETDEEMIVPREDGSVLVDGQCPFYHFLEYFDMEDAASEACSFNTLSGLILDELEHVPTTGEILTWNDLRMEIVDMDRARIDKVLVQRMAPQPSDAES